MQQVSLVAIRKKFFIYPWIRGEEAINREVNKADMQSVANFTILQMNLS